MSVATQSSTQRSMQVQPVRVGVVSFLNTLPLIDGLDRLADLQLRCSVPSLLIEQLESGEVDLALCSSIDYQRSTHPLVIVPCGLLGCEGPTLTVRLYSSLPIDTLREIHCDTDSHTSVALLRILLKEMHGISPRLIDYDAREHVADNRLIESPPAMLLIGDKVISDSPPPEKYPHQMDLGEAWHRHTGLPFVFAIWMARADADQDSIRLAAAALDHQRRHNAQRIDRIVHAHAAARGWPAATAREYLTQRLVYEVTDQRLAGMELFFAKAHEHGLINRLRPLVMLEP